MIDCNYVEKKSIILLLVYYIIIIIIINKLYLIMTIYSPISP